MKTHFYIYSYLREDNTPYYIGKGYGKRAYQWHNKLISVPKDKSRIKILKDNLREDTAFALEIMWIEFYGRKDLGTGILRNRSNGGEGSAGAVHSEETRKKRSESLKGKVGTMKGKSHSQETKNKMSAAKIGKPATSKGKTGYSCSQAEKDKISAAQKGIPKPRFKCPHCNKEASIARLTQWHLDKCKYKGSKIICHT